MWAFVTPAPGGAPATTQASIEGKIVFVGDSLTAGFGVDPKDNFVAKLEAMSARATFVGQGRSGWSTLAYLNAIEEVLAAIPVDADVLVIQLGANDLKESGHTDEVVRKTAANMEKLADRFHAKSPRLRLVLMTPGPFFPKALSEMLRDAGYGPQTPEYLAKLRDAFRDVARRRGFGFIDVTEALTDPADTLDGAHPTPQGHAKLAEAIWKQLPLASGKKE
jgi:lysophospholipase L1-like esterase